MPDTAYGISAQFSILPICTIAVLSGHLQLRKIDSGVQKDDFPPPTPPSASNVQVGASDANIVYNVDTPVVARSIPRQPYRRSARPGAR